MRGMLCVEEKEHAVALYLNLYPRAENGAAQIIAVDFDGVDAMHPQRFTRLVDRVREERSCGREVWLLNVPSELRLWLEVSGRNNDVLERPIPGPRMPQVLQDPQWESDGPRAEWIRRTGFWPAGRKNRQSSFLRSSTGRLIASKPSFGMAPGKR